MKKIITPIRSALNHRHLLKEFVLKDIKGRFAGTMGGAAWTLISPLATIIIYIFVFSVIMRITVTIEETGTDQFIVFFLVGFFPWYFLSDSMSKSVGVLVDNAGLITKVVFPVELLPVGVIISVTFLNGIGMVLFLIYLAAIGYLNLTWLLLIFIFPVYLLFISGLTFLLSAICVFIRDIREILSIIIMIWFFATPVIYPVSMIPEDYKDVLAFNAAGLYIKLFRDAVIVHQVDWLMMAYAVIIAMISYGFGAWFFMRAKPAFGDVL